jgi:arylsulfatase A-like enzyme
LAHLRRTNNLLVNSGTNFTNAFVPTALSGPSRASLLTGQYAHNTGVLENASPLGGEINLNRSSTMATWLRNAGYDTAAFGKSVTVSEGMESLNPSRPPPGWNHFSTGSREGYVLFRNGVKSVFDFDEHNSTDLWADMADSFIRESRPDSKPFMLYLAPIISHQPYQPLPRHVGSMSNVPKWRPPSYNVVPKDVPNRQGIRNAAHWDQQRQRHLETLQAVDEAVGKVYHALSQTGELDNTVFVFTSDNGMMWGEHGLVSTKGNFYDESLRVPLVIRDGRAPRAQTAGQMVLNIDIAPTFAGMAGVQLGHRTDGYNIAHVVRGSNAPVHTSFIMQHKWIEGWNYVDQYGRGGVGIRTEQWKYVEYESGKVDLFNLKTDPHEMRNLGADPAFAWARQTLASRLHAQLPTDHSGPSIAHLSHTVETTSWGLRYLRITGEVSDEGSGGSQVRSPEFFVDTLGQPGWGRGLDTTDGYFNSSREGFRGRIRLDELGPGMHTIYVRARDVAGNWGQVVSFRFHVASTFSFVDPEADTRVAFVPFDWVEDSPTFDGADSPAAAFTDGEDSTASNPPPSDAVMAMESELSELWEPITAGEENPAGPDEADLDELIAAGLRSLE